MSLFEDLTRPYKIYKEKNKKLKELRKRDSFDVSKMRQETLSLQVERDLEEILEEFIDSGEKKSVTVEVLQENKKYATDFLDRQKVDYMEISDTRIKIRS